jgi:hypothetical protein
LLINFLWNKTGCTIWVDFCLSKCTSCCRMNSLRSWKFGWTSVTCISLPSVRDFSHNSCSIVVFHEGFVAGEVGVVGSNVMTVEAVNWGITLLSECWCCWCCWCCGCSGSRCRSWNFGWTSIVWVSLPSVGLFSHNSCSIEIFNKNWISRKVIIVSIFIVVSSCSESSVWISFNLSIRQNTWFRFCFWVKHVSEIIRVFLIFLVNWFLELWNTIILLINFLWNKTGWTIWIDFSLSKCCWWSCGSLGCCFRSWELGWTSIVWISLPSV